jgi:hypothetical protein
VPFEVPVREDDSCNTIVVVVVVVAASKRVENRVEYVPKPAVGWCHYCSLRALSGNPAIRLGKIARGGFQYQGYQKPGFLREVSACARGDDV